MSSTHASVLPALLIGGALAFAGSPAFAQSSEGVVRISDTQQAGPPAAVCETGTYNNGSYYGGYYDSSCPEGYCRVGDHLRAWLGHDQLYSIPVKHPIYRQNIAYQHMLKPAYPGDVYGGQQAPVVYMPTDTTQLGYYYQHVPYWRPQPGRIPPAPYPADWHRSMAGALYSAHPEGVILGTSPVAVQVPAGSGYCPPQGESVISPNPAPAPNPLPEQIVAPNELVPQAPPAPPAGNVPMAPVPPPPASIPYNPPPQAPAVNVIEPQPILESASHSGLDRAAALPELVPAQ